MFQLLTEGEGAAGGCESRPQPEGRGNCCCPQRPRACRPRREHASCVESPLNRHGGHCSNALWPLHLHSGAGVRSLSCVPAFAAGRLKLPGQLKSMGFSRPSA